MFQCFLSCEFLVHSSVCPLISGVYQIHICIHYSLVNVFGEVTGSTYSSLEDNTILISNTTLYCITENENTTQVMWSYVDLAGTSTDVTSTTYTKRTKVFVHRQISMYRLCHLSTKESVGKQDGN